MTFFAIGILSTTATILLVGLFMVHGQPESVRADGMTVSGGDYILTVGSYSDRDEDLLYVIDAPAEKMLVYRFDHARKRIEIVQGVDLAEMRAASDPKASGKKPPTRRRRP